MFKKVLIILGVVIVAGLVIVFLRGNEDTWIKDSRGVWVKHGEPKKQPEEAKVQQELIRRAAVMYQNAKNANQDLSSGPCLGHINDDWVLDLVNSPRQAIDDDAKNQCESYRLGQAKHFVELNIANGEVIRIK